MSNQPPIEVPQGAIRLNTDTQRLEFFAQDRWYEFATDSPTLDGGARALSMGGQAPGDIDIIEFVTIPTQGNATDFGNLSVTRTQSAGLGSRVRGFCTGGMVSPGTYKNEIDFVTFSSTGDATDFGNLNGNARLLSAFSNSTRGVTAGGQPRNDTIDFFTMSSAGDAIDFGDLPATDLFGSGLASPTRGLIKDGSDNDKTISFVTITTTGNARDFGDLSISRGTHVQTASNSTRGIFAGGNGPSPNNPSNKEIQFVTIATLGNSTQFGDLTRATAESNAGASDPTRAIFMGNGPGNGDTIDYVAIATQGDAVDFGNLSASRTHNCGCSNAHGGL